LKFGKYRDISLIGSADIIGTIISSVFWLVLASQISPEKYGEIFYFLGIAGMAVAFVLIGTVRTITVYSSKNIKIESTLYFLSLLLGLVASFIIIVIFYRADVIFLLFGYVIHSLSMGELLGNRIFKSYAKYTLIQKILTLVLGLLFLLIFGADGIIFALAITYVFFSIVIFNRFKKTKINFNLLRERSKFIINNYIVEILTKSNAHLNKLIIVPLLGFGVLGNFSLALQLVGVGLIFSSVVFKYTVPYDARGEENKKLKKISLLVSIVLAFLGVLVAPSIIPIFFPEYIGVIDVIRIISFSIIPMTITNIYASKLLGQENSKQILFSKTLSTVSFIIAIIVLSPYFGIIGVAIGFLLSTIIESVCLILKISLLKK